MSRVGIPSPFPDDRDNGHRSERSASAVSFELFREAYESPLPGERLPFPHSDVAHDRQARRSEQDVDSAEAPSSQVSKRNGRFDFVGRPPVTRAARAAASRVITGFAILNGLLCPASQENEREIDGGRSSSCACVNRGWESVAPKGGNGICPDSKTATEDGALR
ncbi:hypothetical protein HPB47_007791, partial [Ixodes persulcatus]